jgi:hypothetical protein
MRPGCLGEVCPLARVLCRYAEKVERIDVQHLARDENGSILVWMGDAQMPPSPLPLRFERGRDYRRAVQ